jgi:iron(III) transport system substrate-binding protein
MEMAFVESAFSRLFLSSVLLLALGCGQEKTGTGTSAPTGAKNDRVVVYASLDREFAEPVLTEYQKESGARVDAKYDVESTKTVGLTEAIAAEEQNGRARCDLFWNNEILNTLRLKKKGLLQPFHPANGVDYPEAFRAKDGTWYGFAARARVLLVNTKLLPEAERPKHIAELADPKWKGKIGIAKPLFGTTATHATCLFVAWGDEKAKKYFRDLKANEVQVLSGNRQVAMAVGSGTIAVGLTDTDDAMLEISEGSPVAIVYPDRAEGELGTLFIPNTLAVIKGAPHVEAAEALANHLLSPDVEAALARGAGAQIPLNPKTPETARVETPKTVTPMAVDWEAAVARWDDVMAFLATEFAG